MEFHKYHNFLFLFLLIFLLPILCSLYISMYLFTLSSTYLEPYLSYYLFISPFSYTFYSLFQNSFHYLLLDKWNTNQVRLGQDICLNELVMVTVNTWSKVFLVTRLLLVVNLVNGLRMCCENMKWSVFNVFHLDKWVLSKIATQKKFIKLQKFLRYRHHYENIFFLRYWLVQKRLFIVNSLILLLQHYLLWRETDCSGLCFMQSKLLCFPLYVRC